MRTKQSFLRAPKKSHSAGMGVCSPAGVIGAIRRLFRRFALVAPPLAGYGTAGP